VVLFDEIEKAHPDVFNILLQVLEDGRITDSQGRTVSFKNTIIIMTSNLGSPMILEHRGDAETLRKELAAELRRHFRPEFLNRVDETLVFHRLDESQMIAILDIQLRRFASRLQDQNIGFRISDEAKKLIAADGFDPSFGARPLKRAVIRDLETPASRLLIGGELAPGMTLAVEVKDGKLDLAPQAN
jgi:ATP-dependent Clp protease ATP-binding subunit ClpB